MKKLFLVCFTIIFTLISSATLWATDVAIEQVHVYPRGAQIRLKTSVNGKGEIILPNTFTLESIKVIPGDGLLLKNSQVKVRNNTQWLPPTLTPLSNQIEEKKKELSVLESRLMALKQSTLLMEKAVPSDLSISNMSSYLKTTEETREAKEEEQTSVVNAIEDIKQIIADLTKELEEKKPQTQGKVITVEYTALAKGDLYIEAWSNYARWTPEYILSLSTKDQTIQGQMLAKVTQHTGLTWDGAIQLHTAYPISSVETPELFPLIADFKKTTYQTRSMENAMMLKTAAKDEASLAPMEETLTDRIFTAKGNVEGDNSQTMLLLNELSLPITVSIECIPVLSPQAWIVASTEKVEDPLLAGQADLFIDGVGSGRTSVPQVARGEIIRLAFGQTPSVTAAREEIIPKEGSNWLGKGKLAQGYTINVTNGLPYETELVIKDRIPVSAQEKITVSAESLDPQPTEQDSKKGFLTWKLKLRSGEQKKLSVIYRLSFPAEEEIWIQ
ncbi:mucoidy inhibitor MuiA family protein [Aminobacterium sp. MB27-C1]|uniref:mucoidy inhibitor MuiA family protein n=1 Tax=Aminobacterium sp. MB27-C1 TaxID=3070661 RepID=UPI001BCE0BE4|nr:mucoidy inhibitor MuiA family protein [Aminobacterium sp. MB27-C1]WMI70874.1 mucoidy inhibitor MuiA family protein [Aminobacterium sp. MB27-C1]